MDSINSINFNSYTSQLSDSSVKAKEDNFRNILENFEEKTDEELREASIEFEAYFIQTMFKAMRKTINYEDGFMKKSNAELIFQDMQDEAISTNLAQNGGIGIADMIYNNLI